jgi:DNA-binding CsgD family transcriptional regulator
MMLTKRERDVITLVLRGKSNRQIGEELFLSERTIEAHVTHVLNKLGFQSRVQVATWAIMHGFVSTHEVAAPSGGNKAGQLRPERGSVPKLSTVVADADARSSSATSHAVR